MSKIEAIYAALIVCHAVLIWGLDEREYDANRSVRSPIWPFDKLTLRNRSVSDTFQASRLERIAFGSCNKQLSPQPLWDPILAFEPQLWLWTGDAIYFDSRKSVSLSGCYSTQLRQEGYRRLLDYGVRVEGTYDDHDYGLNDCGKKLQNRGQSQYEFLKFIGVRDGSVRHERKGVYSAHEFGTNAQQLKVILLDTRFHRDDHAIPSIGGSKFPMANLIASFIRWLCVFLGIGIDHKGDMLGEEQWMWLEKQLVNSTAAVHIIVSSVQVFTSNPIFESWMHFPASKRRLLSLLRRAAPRGLLFISGDVHHADIAGPPPPPNPPPAPARAAVPEVPTSPAEMPRQGSSIPDRRAGIGHGARGDSESAAAATAAGDRGADGDLKSASVAAAAAAAANRGADDGAPPAAGDLGAGGDSEGALPAALEVTSSGMTHTCATVWFSPICAPLLRTYARHRPAAEQFYTGFNFGTVEIRWPGPAGEGEGTAGGAGDGAAAGEDWSKVPAPTVVVAVRAADGRSVLRARLESDPRPGLEWAAAAMEEGLRAAAWRAWAAACLLVAASSVLVVWYVRRRRRAAAETCKAKSA